MMVRYIRSSHRQAGMRTTGNPEEDTTSLFSSCDYIVFVEELAGKSSWQQARTTAGTVKSST